MFALCSESIALTTSSKIINGILNFLIKDKIIANPRLLKCPSLKILKASLFSLFISTSILYLVGFLTKLIFVRYSLLSSCLLRAPLKIE